MFQKTIAVLGAAVLLMGICSGCGNSAAENSSFKSSVINGKSRTDGYTGTSSSGNMGVTSGEASSKGGMSVIDEKAGLKFMTEEKDTSLFSFQYDGKPSKDFIGKWKKKETQKHYENYLLLTIEYLDPNTGLSVALEIKNYKNGSVVEWVARLKNTGTRNTPIIENFYIADLDFAVSSEAASQIVVNNSKGTDIRRNDFMYTEKRLNKMSTLRYSPSGGRSTSGDSMPYFNLNAQSQGYILAVGWTGKWMTTFKRDIHDNINVKAGMEKTRFVLYPGEQVRTPSFAMLRWTGEALDGYNAWRQYMLDCHTPHTEDGKIVTLPITCGAWGGDSASKHVSVVDAISKAGLDYDAYWVDAGWYGSNDLHSSDQYGDEWFKNAGNWFHNTVLYPKGLSVVSAAAHMAGYDFLLWFEPERAWNDSKIVKEHSAWFLKGEPGSTSYIFDLGNKEARNWLANFISGKLKEYGVDIYRQDFNIDPLPFWRANDTDNRQGITEMKYIEGLYDYLDSLREKNPELILDNCAGGGRRLDFEMLGRALPFWRSDYQCFPTYDTTGCQIQTYGISYWIPLSGTGVQSRSGDTYSFRSNLAYAMQCPPALDNLSWQTEMFAQFHKAQQYFPGDYYPLTATGLDDPSAWYAYQMHRDDLRSGFILAFRRENSAKGVMTFEIYGARKSGKYEFTDADTGKTWTEVLAPASGGRRKLTLNIENARDSKLIFYKAVN